MKLGIFAKTFSRPTLPELFAAVKEHGLGTVQFNLVCAGLPTLPEKITSNLPAMVRQAAANHGVEIAAISGTFNLIHPDLEMRRAGLRRLGVLAAACGDLGTSIITLCTGTRDPSDMWHGHPENASAEAWQELVRSIEEALAIAERYQVVMAIEPEVCNVIDSAAKARRLLDQFKSPRLKIIIDPANLFQADDFARMRLILDQAFELLGPDLVIAHAKDVDQSGGTGRLAAGTGVLDYDYYLELLRRVNFSGPLILHGLTEAEVDGCVRFLKSKLAEEGNQKETNG